jgi:predicted MFS family arabinose efflux permease
VFGSIVGPPIGGFLYQNVNAKAPYIVCAGLIVVDLIGRLILKVPQRPQAVDKPKPSPWLLMRKPVSLMLTVIIGIVATALASTISNYYIFNTLSGVEVSIPIVWQNVFGLDPAQIGAGMLSFLLPFALAAGFVDYLCRIKSFYAVAIVGLPAVSAAVVLLGLPNAFWLSAIALAGFSASLATAFIPLLPMLTEYAMKHAECAYGQVYSLYNIAMSAGLMVGPIFATNVLEHKGFMVTTLILAALLALTVPLMQTAHVMERGLDIERLLKLENDRAEVHGLGHSLSDNAIMNFDEEEIEMANIQDSTDSK